MTKKINSLLFVSLLVSFVHCQEGGSNSENMTHVEKIYIKAVNFTIMTPLSVDCNKFEQAFENHRAFWIKDSVEIDEFLNQLIKLEPIDSTYMKSVDTRAKIEIISSEDTNVICVGNLTLLKNNKFYKTPQKLIDSIEQME